MLLECLKHMKMMIIFTLWWSNKYIKLRICRGGDIFDKVLELDNFNEQEALTIFIQIVRSVVYY
jgi:calcium-dependent protein kinase